MLKKNFIILLFITFVPIVIAGTSANHNLSVVLDPGKHSLTVNDEITVAKEDLNKEITFVLNNKLKVKSETPGVSIRLVARNLKPEDVGIDREDFDSTVGLKENKYIISFRNNKVNDTFILSYSGIINYPIKQLGEEYARGFSQTPGIIDEKGIYLAGSTSWIPKFNDDLITFKLKVKVPETWNVVSQGKRTQNKIETGLRTVLWESPEPTEEVYLISAKFTEYSQQAGNVDVLAFLRTPDEGLANKYLEATAQYLELYRKLIGDYPYSKFALVENFWETGYGMPSFTLLGEQIIRFPFIINSSYPHELLHNYWGNSVYVDSKTGNWCEGLTAYLADHLIDEQHGQAEEWRRATLQKYTDFVTPENDFPLNKFLSRYSASSEAIGYGKTSFLWNMLREEVGDEAFIKSLQKFYKDNKFRTASFSDIKKAFEETTGDNLDTFFDQWVNRTGAPELQLSGVVVTQDTGGYKIHFTLKQIQKEGVFSVNVPIAVYFEKKAEIKNVLFNQREQSYELTFHDNPLGVRVDPQFNIFRKLHYNEIPPSLTKILGANDIVIVLPSKASSARQEIYKSYTDILSGDVTKKFTVVYDSSLSVLPAGKSAWVLGEENIYRDSVNKALTGYNTFIANDSIRIDNKAYLYANHSFVISARHPFSPSNVIVFISSDNKKSIEGLARKVPHYGKYSYLVFEGNEPANIAKGEWIPVGSPLDINVSSELSTAVLPKRKALAELPPVFSSKRLKNSVYYLASEELSGRAPGTPGIKKAAEFIAGNFKAAGLLPGSDDSTYYQSWSEVIDSAGNKATVSNVIGIIPGTNPNLKNESVVVSAHYDHLGLGWPSVHKGDEGKIHFGADDNASGVSVLLELAHTLGKTLKPQRTIVFVAFTNEESGLLGSKYYVNNNKRFPSKNAIADLNFDAVGRLENKKVSIISASSAKEWRYIFLGAGYVTGFEPEIITQDLDASDQVTFIKAGIPGVQFFSGVNSDYHRPTDTPDKIDIAGLIKVASLGREAIVYLGDRIEPLTFQGSNSSPNQSAKQPAGERKVSTGCVPDFAFSGQGVRISDVTPNSPFAKAGLVKGDIITEFGEVKINDLRDYSNELKKHNPGDTVSIKYLRDNKETKNQITLIAK